MKKFTSIFALALCFGSWLSAVNVFQAIRQDNHEVVQEWLNDAPDLTIRNSKGYTVLIQAVISQRWEMAHWFLYAGVDKYAVDYDGLTAYDYALEFEQDARHRSHMQFALGMATVAGIVLSVYLYDTYVQEIACLRNSANYGPIPFYTLDKELFYRFPEHVPLSALLR